MGPAARRPFHNLGDGRLAILSQAVDAAAHEEFGAELFSQAIKLVNVAFAVSDMYTSPRLSSQFGRPAQIIKPTDTFLLIDGNSGQIDPALELCSSLELGA